jgi:pantetheine-phosphate adenylyltransferase
MTEKIALYCGSFDPPTNGHKWVMEQISKQYDKGYIAIGVNVLKMGRFSLEERLMMLKDIAKDYPNLEITSFDNYYQADYANLIGAKYLIRGCRNGLDYAYETDLNYINAGINSDLETVVFIPPKDLLQISSTTVMGLVGFEAWETEVAKMVPNSVFQMIYQREMDKAWKFILDRHYSHQALKVLERYKENHRHYHSLFHITQSLMEKDRIKSLLLFPKEVEMAIIYHDAIYDPVSMDNEEESSKLWSNSSLLLDIKKMILATKHDGNNIINEDTKYLLDIDLIRLSKPYRIFSYYNGLVRKEYDMFDDITYSQGRIEVFRSFLRKPFIYHTMEYRDRYEIQARKNLELFIKELEKIGENK